MQYWSIEIEKQVGVRLQRILGDPDLRSAYEKFGATILRRSSIFHGLADFLDECDVKGGTCFEIGTWNGLTASVLSRHFRQVVTVDIAHNPEKHAVLEHLGIKNVKCIDIVDNAQKAAIAKDLDFDFAYLDGNHADDTESDFALVEKCGRVLFHECWPFQEKVWSKVHQLPPSEVRFGGEGLALWTKT